MDFIASLGRFAHLKSAEARVESNRFPAGSIVRGSVPRLSSVYTVRAKGTAQGMQVETKGLEQPHIKPGYSTCLVHFMLAHLSHLVS